MEKIACSLRLLTLQVHMRVNGKSTYEMRQTTNLTLTTLPVDSSGFQETLLTVKSLTEHHSGEWLCSVGAGGGGGQNNRGRAITVIVIRPGTKMCPATVSQTPRGTYSWGPALGGYTLKQDCEKIDDRLGEVVRSPQQQVKTQHNFL